MRSYGLIILHFLFLLFITNIIGGMAAAYMTPETLKWYHTLPLSPYNPPRWVFMAVWPILFIMISFSMALVWGKVTPWPFICFLGFTALWSFLFFYMRSPLGGLAGLIGFLGFGFMHLRALKKRSRLAFYLFLPTLLWGIFALYLNAYILFKISSVV